MKYIPLWTQNPAAFASPTLTARLAVPVPRQSVPPHLDLPVGLVLFRFPQGLLCPGPLDPSMGHPLEVLFLHLEMATEFLNAVRVHPWFF